MCRKCGRLAADHPHRQEQEQQQWHKVSGTISRPRSHAGARYQLIFKLAFPDGLYPPGLDAGIAFKTEASSQVDCSILKFSVVFMALDRTSSFVNGIEMYLGGNNMDLELLDDQGSKTEHLMVTEIAPFPITFQSSVLVSHYKPQNFTVSLAVLAKLHIYSSMLDDCCVSFASEQKILAQNPDFCVLTNLARLDRSSSSLGTPLAC
mmetsp:Transcript_2603/g.3889  ORF Transcript_2603/g.3889 Transcript_2603/m.3889 type:complete len:206 (+) Transcript_2603:88-705(+)